MAYLMRGGRIVLIRGGQIVLMPLATDALDRGAEALSRSWLIFRFVLDHRDRMAERRVQAEQGRAALGNLGQEHPSRDVPVHDGLVAKVYLQLIQLQQLHGQRTLQVLVAVDLNRMPI